MVVDIRYHLASLVAVFLALGLGILIGAALLGGDGLERQERWLASLERELQSLREAREQNAALLEKAGAELELYKAFAARLSDEAMRGLLGGERAALVAFGGDASATAGVEDLLQRSGATIVRKATVAPSFSETELVRLLGPLQTEALGAVKPPAQKAGAALAAALAGEPGAGFAAARSPAFSLEALPDGTPSIAVVVLGARPERHPEAAWELVQALKAHGIRTAAVVVDETAWSPALPEWGIPFVTHFDTPMGRLSLVYALRAGEAGGFGFEPGRSPWPEVDFE